MQLGIFAKTFDGKSPSIVLPQVKAAGFTVAQYNMACSGLAAMPDEIPTSVITEIKQAAQSSGITLNALSATYNMIHPDVSEREKGHRRLAVIAKAAQDLDIPLITLCTGTRDATDQWKHHPDNTSDAAWHDLIQSMQTAITIADRYNVNLGIEPELANVINSAAKARQLLDQLKSPRLKIIFDPANLFETETVAEQRRIVSSALALLSSDIAMAHAKDRTTSGEFVAAGTGVLDYPHFLSELKQSGFDGSLITHGLSAAEAPMVCEFLKLQQRDLISPSGSFSRGEATR
jgi:sugar phosphate isomerase/epimerase